MMVVCMAKCAVRCEASQMHGGTLFQRDQAAERSRERDVLFGLGGR